LRKLDFLFIFLAILISADYLTSVIGINWLEEQNQLVVQVYKLIGNWFVTFTLLYLFKLAALVGIYKLAELRKETKRAGAAVSVVLLFAYFVIVINNAVLIASAQTACDFVNDSCSYFNQISYVSSNYATKEDFDPVTGYSPVTVINPVVSSVTKSSFKIKSIHAYSNGWLYKAKRYCGDNVDYTTNFAQSIEMRYNSNTVGWIYFFGRSDGFDMYFTYTESFDNVPDGAELYLSPVNTWVLAEGCYTDGYGKMWAMTSTYYSFSDTTFNDVIEMRTYYAGIKYYSYNYLPAKVYVSYEQSNSVNISYCHNGLSYLLFVDAINSVPIKIIDENNVILFNDTTQSASVTSNHSIKQIELYTISLSHAPLVETLPKLETCPWIAQTELTESDEVKFLFVDAKSSALLNNINFTIVGDDFSDSGIYDYKVTYTSDQLTEGNTYSYTASKDGYRSVSGSFTFTGGQVIKLYFLPDLTNPNATEHVSDPVNNTALTFTVLDSETKEPVEGAYVTVNGKTKITNSNGFTWFEVPKNNTYSYTVSAQGYFTISGSVAIGTEQEDVTVELMPVSSVPTTAVTDGSGSGSASTGGGGTGTSLEQGINELYSAAPALIRLAILVALMSMFGMLMRAVRRR
jgi:hypothetical protein